MAESRVPPLARLPTLTEVVQEGEGPARAAPEPGALPPPAAEPSAADEAPAPAVDEARIVDAVVTALQPRIDLMLEYRLREALAPVLARAADTLVTDARDELARTLRDVVARAVGQELARRRPR